MEGTIKVTPQELKNAAGNLQQGGVNIGNYTQQMTEMISQISGQIWSGDAAENFKNKFSNLNDDIQTMIRMINEHVQDLNDMATQYETAEKTNMDTIASLETDFIS